MGAQTKGNADFYKRPKNFQGRRLGIYWPDDLCFYYGVLQAAPSAQACTIAYDDGMTV